MITTVITSYNKGPYLADAIRSALDQDYRPHEVIVVDDGSTDNTCEVAEAFGDRIRYVRQPNRGQAHARNRGTREARGQFVAFLDGDDRWRPGKLSAQIALFGNNHRLGVAYADCVALRDGRATGPSRGETRSLYRGNVLDRLLVDNVVPFSSTLVRRECLFDVGMFDEGVRVADDYDLWLRMARKYQFDYVDEVFLEYRLGIDSIGSRVGNKFYHVMRIQQRFIDRYYDGRYPRPGVVRKATARKYAARGDHLLAHNQQGKACAAYCQAFWADPLDPQRYANLLRSLIPNWVVTQMAKHRQQSWQ